MPARSRRQRLGEQNLELLHAIIARMSTGNTREYEELLNGWEVKRQAALDAQNTANEKHAEQVVELEQREAALVWRAERFEKYRQLAIQQVAAALDMSTDWSPDEYQQEIDRLLSEPPNEAVAQ